MSPLKYRPLEYAKAIAALVGGILTAAVSQGLLHGTAAAWAAIVGAALTTGLVFVVPNADEEPA